MKESNKLTKTEEKILNFFQYRMDDRAIALELGVSHHTVHAHRKSIYRKLDVHERADAIIEGIRRGYLKLDDIQNSDDET